MKETEDVIAKNAHDVIARNANSQHAVVRVLTLEGLRSTQIADAFKVTSGLRAGACGGGCIGCNSQITLR